MALTAILVGCSEQTTQPAGAEAAGAEPTATPATGTAAAPAAEPVEDGVVVIRMLQQGGRTFNDPVGVHVEPGTTVRFVNVSGMHSTTAYHSDNGRRNRIPAEASSWDSGLMARPNQTFEVVLTVEGVYDYFCIPHETTGHVGRIVVGDPSASPAADLNGLPAAAIEALPAVETIVAQGVVRP